MIIGIHQPNYLPWLGYFYKIARSDIFVFLDNAQYSKSSFINRNKIKTSQGAAWLTVDVLKKGRFKQLINEVEINNDTSWSSTHEKTISQNYSKARYFEKYKNFFEDVYHRRWQQLVDLNEALTTLICDISGISGVKFIRASEINVRGQSTELLINICKAVGADTYLSGFGAKQYMDEKAFEQANISLRYYDFEHPTYHQLWGEFIPNLSIIDLLFNEGDKSLEILLRKIRQD